MAETADSEIISFSGIVATRPIPIKRAKPKRDGHEHPFSDVGSSPPTSLPRSLPKHPLLLGTSPPGFDLLMGFSFPGMVSHQVPPAPAVPDVMIALPIPTELSDSVDITQPEPSTETAPDLVRASYSVDLDILKIHEAIRALFASKLGHLDEVEEQISNLKSKLSSGYLSLIEADKIATEIAKLEEEFNMVESGERWNEYISQAKPLFDQYLPIASDDVKGIVKFTGEADLKDADQDRVKKRKDIIHSYLRIAEKYIRLDIVCEVEKDDKCPGCGGASDEALLDEDEGLKICSCGYQQPNLVKISTFKDTMRVNVDRSDYEDRSNFIKAYDRFMGTKIPKIPDTLYSMLDEYFIKEGYPIGEVIRNDPRFALLPNGKRAGTSVDLMKNALSATSNASYYDCINYISSNYWGWNLPDLSLLRERVIDEYDRTQKVYKVIRTRGSSLNVQIRLYVQLRAVDYPCEWSDFKILSARESLEYHHQMWQIMCEHTGVKFTPII